MADNATDNATDSAIDSATDSADASETAGLEWPSHGSIHSTFSPWIRR